MTAGSPSSPATAHEPPPAERARTVATRPVASLYCTGLGVSQLWGATTTTAGDVLLVVPADGVVTTALQASPLGDIPARLTVTDRTPFPLRHPVRGLLQVSGWVSPVDPWDVTRLVLEFAEIRPCDSLFDVGFSATLVRLEPAEVSLEEAGVCIDIDVDDFLAARPDALSRAENELMVEHCQPLSRLCSRVQRWAGRHDDVRLLGLDRFAVRFRVQGRDGCYDLRVPFAAPLSSPAEFGPAVAQLLTPDAV